MLDERAQRLLAFARRSVLDQGFGHLDRHGRVDPGRDLELWINARMTYVFAVASLAGVADAADLARHGVDALTGVFEDPVHGGWRSTVPTGSTGRAVEGTGAPADEKSCYDHAFVVLASSAATTAGVPGAADLLDRALAVHASRFWEERPGACAESFTAGWRPVGDYRGANSNMHTVEAYLFAADATGDSRWLDRALRITELVVGRVAREHEWRVVEHFDGHWDPRPEHHRDRPADPFRPYGATPGHGFEWARLAAQLHAALAVPPSWLLEAAVGLFERAAADTDEGRGGFPYTTDWHGVPVVTERFHWVQCEASMAASALARATGEPRYAALAERWWHFAEAHFVEADGSWLHELDAELAPSATTWAGKPDAYHAFNALLLPGLPLAPTAAVALRDLR